MLLGRLRTAGGRDLVAGMSDLATLVASTRALVTGARDIIAITRELAPAAGKNARQSSAFARNGHQPAFATNGHQLPADYAEQWWRSALVPAGLLAGSFVAHAVPAYLK